jgi:hypothetical protein
MSKKKLLCGGAAVVTTVLTLVLFTRAEDMSRSLSERETLRVFGGQATTCYQMAANDCPPPVGEADCTDYGTCTFQEFTCDEEGRQATYTSYFCPNSNSDYNFRSNSQTYQSAVDMGANATNGNTGENQTSTFDCGLIIYCATSSDNPTCIDRTTPCVQVGDDWYCNELSSNSNEMLVYSPDPTTPACPQPVGSIQRRIPTSLVAAAVRNGAYYVLQAE